MKGKIIIIGESQLEIIFKNSVPVDAFPGGALLNAAQQLASNGKKVIFLSEIGNDKPGEIIADTLTKTGVDISLTDRHILKTPIVLNIDGATSRYCANDDGEGFDIIWPRVDSDDIIVFGGYYAVDSRIRHQLSTFISNAVDHNATIVYVPDVADDRIPRITKVMPYVYENLELANRVITLPSDLEILFNHNDDERARKENFAFYVDIYTHLTDAKLLADAIAK